MNSTNDCMPMRAYVDDFTNNHPDYIYQNHSIAPLSTFAKFGNQLSNLYVVLNNSTNKLQLWYSGNNRKTLPGIYGSNVNLGFDKVSDILDYAINHQLATKIFPFEFDDVNILLELDDPFDYMAFLIENNNRTGLYIRNAMNLNLINWYDEIILIGEDLLLAKEGTVAFILNRFGKKMTSIGEHKFIRLISNNSYLVEINKKQQILNFDGEIIAPVILNEFIRLTDESHYISKYSGKYFICDFYGNVASGGYNAIKNSNNSYIVSQKENVFYLLDLSGKIILESDDYMTVVRNFWSNG